jgi:hypothetical protein
MEGRREPIDLVPRSGVGSVRHVIMCLPPLDALNRVSTVELYPVERRGDRSGAKCATDAESANEA